MQYSCLHELPQYRLFWLVVGVNNVWGFCHAMSLRKSFWDICNRLHQRSCKFHYFNVSMSRWTLIKLNKTVVHIPHIYWNSSLNMALELWSLVWAIWYLHCQTITMIYADIKIIYSTTESLNSQTSNIKIYLLGIYHTKYNILSSNQL